MTDPGPAPPPGPAPLTGTVPRGGTLGLRLALAFLTVALVAVALLAGLTAAFASADVSNLATQQRGELAKAIAALAGAAWDRNNTWPSANLSPVRDLAASSRARICRSPRWYHQAKPSASSSVPASKPRNPITSDVPCASPSSAASGACRCGASCRCA